jgi:DMSO reductase family type II enzyme heme b subunit
MKKLKDDWVGNRLWPRNLTKPWLFRAGSDPKDIYTRISAGISGTPMPSFDDPQSKKKLSEEDKWHVVNYVTSIKNEARRIKDGDTVVKAKRLTGELPKDVNDEKWKGVESTAYPLVGQIIAKERFFTPSVEEITVKAVYNDKDIAFLLEWDDRTNSIPGDAKAQELADGELNEDAVAIQLPVTIPEEMEKPYFGMGDSSHPVNVWHWKSGSTKAEQSIKVMDSTGFKNIKARDKSNVTAKGGYNKGTWKVMMIRPLKTDNKDDMQFEEGRFTPIAFATWDGTNGEKGSKHTITTWYWILLKPPTGSNVVFIPLLVAGIVLGAELLIARSAQKK